jgi:hypothetical protein
MAQSAIVASVQLWAKKDGDTDYTRIDLYTEEPIKLTLSVTNIIDPLSTTSIFSRSFRVPNTQANNAFFKAVFNVNSVSFDASKKASAYINDSGSFYTNGNIRLSATYQNDRDGNVEYEIIFMGETSDFASQIGGGFLSDVNLERYNHEQNYLNIVRSWDTDGAGMANGLFGGDIVCPLINWGYDYEGGLPVQNTTALYTGLTGGLSGFTDVTKPLKQSQLKPTIRAKALWDAIFSETEYTYESEFLDSNFFRKMYIIAEKQSRAELEVRLLMNANNTAPQSFSSTGSVPVLFPNEVSDPQGVWDATTSIYTAEASSGTNYVFTVTWTDRLAGSPAPGSGQLYIIRLRNAVTGASLAANFYTAGTLPTARTRTWSVPLVIGTKVRVTVELVSMFPSPTLTVNFGGAQLVQSAGPEIVNMSGLMPDNIRKLDFMKSIINRFKLVFVPSRDNEKKFTITPWKDWILQGTAYDWNHLLDTSKDIKSTPLFYGQNRFQVYADQEDADFPNYNYQLSYKQTYGQLNLDSDNELLTGSITVKDQFAPTPIFPIGGAIPGAAGTTLQNRQGLSAEFLIPWISKADFTAVQNNPIQPKLRLVFYNGKQFVPGYGTADALTWYLQNDAGTAVGQGVWPLMSEYSFWPVSSSNYDLSWQNIPPLYNTELTNNPLSRTQYDTFKVYWKSWYDTNFDPYSRKVEANLILDYTQMLDLKFNDYFFIKDAWYFVNKVTDYIAGQTTSCRVELIKLGNNIGITIPPTNDQGYPHGLCYVSTSFGEGATFCEAYCCAVYGTTLSGVYYTDSAVLSSSTIVYDDPYRTNPANPGFYAGADGTVFEVGPGGFIIAFFDGSSCEPCEESVFYEYEDVCFSPAACGACCCDGSSSLVTIWGNSATFDQSTVFWLNSNGTGTPTNGWYSAPGSGVAVLLQNGIVMAVATCDTCACGGEIYERSAAFSEVSEPVCTSCTSPIIEISVWLDAPTFAEATVIWSDSSGTTTVGEGTWRAVEEIGTPVYVTDEDGVITGTLDCTGCTGLFYYEASNCEAPELLQTFSSEVPIVLGQVVSSILFPGQCWTVVGPAFDGPPIDIIHDNCASCLETWTCNCIEYEVTANGAEDSTVSYNDCEDQAPLFQTITAGDTVNICACEDSIGIVSGAPTITAIGSCGTAACYVFELDATAEIGGVVEYEECVSGEVQTITVEPGGIYEICANLSTVTVLSGSVTITQGALCG